MGQIAIKEILRDAQQDQTAGKQLTEALLEACKKHYPEQADEVLKAIGNRLDVEIYMSRCSRTRAVESCIENEATVDVASIQVAQPDPPNQEIAAGGESSLESTPEPGGPPDAQPLPDWTKEQNQDAPPEQTTPSPERLPKDTADSEEKKGFFSRFRFRGK